MSDILSRCPCCGSELEIDLTTGEVFGLDNSFSVPNPKARPRLQVQHATPEFLNTETPRITKANQ